MLNTYMAERIYHEKHNRPMKVSAHRRALNEVIAEFKAARLMRPRKNRRG